MAKKEEETTDEKIENVEDTAEEAKETEETKKEAAAEETENEAEPKEAAETGSEDDYLPKKRVIRRKKSKREKEHPLSSAIRLAVESGKADFGSRKGLKNSIHGKVMLIVLARNTPADLKEGVLKYSKAADIPVIEFDGNNMELGSVCGKPFSVSVLSIYEVGSSNILDIAKERKK